MDLSQLDPRIWIAKILWYIVTAILCLIMGFFGGCQYKQNQWDAEKFKQLEESTRKERKDATQGTAKIEEFKQGEKQAGEGRDFVRQGIAGKKPLVRIVAQPDCPKPVEVLPKEGTVKNEITGIYLTAHFMQLYDVSVQPTDVKLRAGNYEEAEGPSFDEGFEKVIVVNNAEYAAVRRQLNTLIDRIEQKQKLYQPEGTF